MSHSLTYSPAVCGRLLCMKSIKIMLELNVSFFRCFLHLYLRNQVGFCFPCSPTFLPRVQSVYLSIHKLLLLSIRIQQQQQPAQNIFYSIQNIIFCSVSHIHPVGLAGCLSVCCLTVQHVQLGGCCRCVLLCGLYSTAQHVQIDRRRRR